MNYKLGVLTLILGLGLTGCTRDADNMQQASIAEQALPANIADPPGHVNLLNWGVRNPHFDVNSAGNVIQISSTDHGWNGQFVDIYYVPYTNVEAHHGDYALRSRDTTQRIATARMKANQTWSATWDTKGNKLPASFYILVKTNTGQANIERVMKSDGTFVDGGAESPVQ